MNNFSSLSLSLSGDKSTGRSARELIVAKVNELDGEDATAGIDLKYSLQSIPRALSLSLFTARRLPQARRVVSVHGTLEKEDSNLGADG